MLMGWSEWEKFVCGQEEKSLLRSSGPILYRKKMAQREVGVQEEKKPFKKYGFKVVSVPSEVDKINRRDHKLRLNSFYRPSNSKL